LDSTTVTAYARDRVDRLTALSAAHLESQALNAIEVEGLSHDGVEAYLYMAPNAIDYSGYPDCRPEFFDTARQTLEYGSKLWTQYGVRIQIETPIIELSKAEIAEMGLRLEAPLEQTWSCYDGNELPCEGCDSYVLRARGFEEAGIPDPLMVRLGRA
jgi:7-cyano-7-deazaguanine synthase